MMKVLPVAKELGQASANLSVGGKRRLRAASRNNPQKRRADAVERERASAFRNRLSLTPDCANCVFWSAGSASSEISRSSARGPELSHSLSPTPDAAADCQNDLPSSDAEAESAVTAAASWNASHTASTKRDGAGHSRFSIAGLLAGPVSGPLR